MRCLVLIGVVGCGFAPRIAPADGDLIAPADSSVDVMVDGPPPQRVLYASTDQTLYAIDVDAHTATMIGLMGESINGLAWANNMLVGIPATGERLVRIDTATAQITTIATLSEVHSYYALTVAGSTLYSATPDLSSNIYSITMTGTVTLLGSLGGSTRIAGDLAWVNGVLYASLEQGYCYPNQCLATVNTTTGAATAFRTDAPADVWGLSGYRGELWALRGNGDVNVVNPTNGTFASTFNTSSIDWWEGAQ